MKDFLFTLAVLLLVARVFGEVAKRCHQPAVLGELVAGLALGPSLFGWLAPHLQAEMFGPSETLPRLTTLSVCFLLAVTGLEIDLPLIGRRLKTAIWLSSGGLFLPLLLGFAWGWFLPEELRGGKDPFLVSSFIAVALAISAIPVVAKVLMDLGALRTGLGQLILAAAMIDDAVGWILLSMVAGLATHGGYLGTETLSVILITVLTLVVSLKFGPKWMGRLVAWSNKRDPGARSQLSLFLICLMVASSLTEWAGLEPGFGAFLLGIVAGQSRRFSHRVLHSVENITVSFFSPLFFATAGLKVDLLALLRHPLWLYTLVLILLATVSKFVGCYLGGKKAGLKPLERLLVGAGMNPRGAMGVIVATLGLKLEVINQDVYSMLVAMALLTSIAAPPILRHILNRLELGPPPSSSFIGNLKRVLLPTAGGENSRVAARMFAEVAARQELEVTTLMIGEENFVSPILAPAPNLHVHDLKRKVTGSVEETVLDEAHLGYELLVLGAGRVEGVVDRILQDAPCPTLIVRAPKAEQELLQIDSILLPVVGSQHSRRAVEMGAWWAKCYGSKITLIHVIPPEVDEELMLNDGYHRYRYDFATRLLDGFADELRHDGHIVDTLVVDHAWPEKAIVEQLNEKHSLVILGTNLEPLSGRAFLGHCVEHVLEYAEPAVLVLSIR